MEHQYLICIGPIKNRNAGRPPFRSLSFVCVQLRARDLHLRGQGSSIISEDCTFDLRVCLQLLVGVWTGRGWGSPLGTSQGGLCRPLLRNNDTISVFSLCNIFIVNILQYICVPQCQRTCPLRWQVLRLLGTLCDTPMGGWGAGLFFGISASMEFEDDTDRPFRLTPSRLSGPGKTCALTATSFQEKNKTKHFDGKTFF